MTKTAFLFAGQGSQYVGMGKDLYEAFPESKMVFNQACDALGFDIARLCFEGPFEELKATDVSQPAIVTVTIAAFEAFRRRCASAPLYCAGLSLGEYSALVAAGALKFRDAVLLVRKRGQIMEEEARRSPGKMAAVLELDLDTVRSICAKTQAEIANLNCPGQVVITGKAVAVNDAVNLCTAAGAKRVVPLEVSGGFHSSLMRGASERLAEVLRSVPLEDAAVPVVSNVTAAPQTKADQIRQNLVTQVHASVRWEESMRFMRAQGVEAFYEFGPGKVLRGLMRRIDPAAQVVSIEKAKDITSLDLSQEGKHAP